MLVYLDTGDIARLDEALAANASDATRFVEQWRASGCELALTLHHAQEIAQQDLEEKRERRLATIGQLTPLRFVAEGSIGVLEREVLAQLVGLALGGRPDYAASIKPTLFLPLSIRDFEQYVRAAVPALRLMTAPQQMTAEARNLSRAAGKTPPLKKQVPPGVDLEALKTQFLSSLDPTILESPEGQFFKQMVEAIAVEWPRQGNMRAALEIGYGIRGHDCLSKVPDEDLASVATFFWMASEMAADLDARMPADGTLMRPLISRLDPYLCPGYRLEMAVKRGQEISGHKAAASDEGDRAHVNFMPYVDRAFVDRRTAEFLRQQSQARSDLLPAEAIAHIRRSSSLTNVADQLATGP